MPQVIVLTSIDGREESLTEYLCDWSGCPNVAVEVLGGVRELNMSAAVAAVRMPMSMTDSMTVSGPPVFASQMTTTPWIVGSLRSVFFSGRLDVDLCDKGQVRAGHNHRI